MSLVLFSILDSPQSRSLHLAKQIIIPVDYTSLLLELEEEEKTAEPDDGVLETPIPAKTIIICVVFCTESTQIDEYVIRDRYFMTRRKKGIIVLGFLLFLNG